MNDKTISENAYHENHGAFIDQELPLTEIDFHSLNGFLETKVTYDALKNKVGHLQPLIIARSTAFGGGNFTSHWTGDNQATWEDIKISISSIFNLQIYGLPFVGEDICGFQKNTTEELCARWMQLGAFYPFSRNHNEIGARSQEPYAWGNDSIVFKASMKSLKLRYSLLKFYYSLFVRANGAGSIFRPLFFEFPDDEDLLSLDDQFLLGSELMVAPALDENVTQVKVYFPLGSVYYCYYSGAQFTSGSHHLLQAPINSSAPLFIKESSIVHTNDVTNVVRSSQLNNHYTLKIAFREIEASPLTVYEAEGKLLSISNLESANVLDKCVSKNCVVSVKAKGIRGDPSSEENILHVVLNFEDNQGDIEEIYIDALEIYGVRNSNGYKLIRQVLKTPLKVSYTIFQGISVNLDQVHDVTF